MILEEFPLPYVLKGSSFVNGIYDGFRRPGMTLAGIALLGTGGNIISVSDKMSELKSKTVTLAILEPYLIQFDLIQQRQGRSRDI